MVANQSKLETGPDLDRTVKEPEESQAVAPLWRIRNGFPTGVVGVLAVQGAMVVAFLLATGIDKSRRAVVEYCDDAPTYVTHIRADPTFWYGLAGAVLIGLVVWVSRFKIVGALVGALVVGGLLLAGYAAIGEPSSTYGQLGCLIDS